jgi:DNA processing protein
VNEIEALTALTQIPHLGSIKIRLLMEYFGSAAAAFEASHQEIAPLPGFGNKILQVWEKRHSLDWQKELELAHRLNIRLISFKDPDYPKQLREIPDFPVLLYVKGHLLSGDANALAVVGTRSPSHYGLEMAEKISRDLAAQGVTIVSGLARGIDTAAHKGALQSGRTIAVIGSGLADPYPPENRQLAECIAQRGALISQFPLRTPPDRQNFPQRNITVSGISSLGTLLIEAPQISGAMLTMKNALAHGRHLFALPGPAGTNNFQGNHSLLKSGEAKLTENAEDILQNFASLFSQKTKNPSVVIELELEEQEFMKKFPQDECSFDNLACLTKLPVMKLNVLLMSLIMKRAVKEYPGKTYKKLV